MPVIEWGSCTNCGRSCAGPHGSFCSDICRVEYNKKQQLGNAEPAKPSYPTRGGSGKTPPPKKGGKCSIVLLPPAIGIAYGLVRLAKALR